MPIHLLAIRKFEEPRTWSIGMCSIAVVMLLMTCSQSGSFATSVSQITKSPQAAAALDGVGPEKVYQVVQSTFAEQPGVIEIDGARKPFV